MCAVQEGTQDLIVHFMTRHGETVRSLAESPLVGPRFKDFIARFEISMKPPPFEKIERYIFLILLHRLSPNYSPQTVGSVTLR